MRKYTTSGLNISMFKRKLWVVNVAERPVLQLPPHREIETAVGWQTSFKDTVFFVKRDLGSSFLPTHGQHAGRGDPFYRAGQDPGKRTHPVAHQSAGALGVRS